MVPAELKQISALITGAGPDLVGVQEVLASHGDLAPQVFDDLLAALGPGWTGHLSQQPDERGIRVGWLSTGQLTGAADVVGYPPGVPATTVDDQGTMITAIKRGALAVTYTRGDGLTVHAFTAHLKSKMLTFPGHDPQHPRSTRKTRANAPASDRPGPGLAPAGPRARQHRVAALGRDHERHRRPRLTGRHESAL